MIRVLHVLPTLAGGGAEGFVANLLPSLCNDGVQCGVMTIYPSTVPFSPEACSRIDVIDVRRRNRYEAGFFARMVAEMKAWRPDVVHTHMHNGKYWGRLAALLAGRPAIVHTAHNPCDPHRLIGEPMVDRLLNAATAAIITFSRAQRAFLCKLERIPPQKVVVIPNGIVHGPRATSASRASARLTLGLNDEFAVFVVGTLYAPKNQRLAVEAIAALSAVTRSRIALCLIGDGVDQEAIRRRSIELGIADRVRMLGHRSDVRAMLHGADALLVPSLTEGMPLAVLEAMSAAVPVISTPWTGVHDLLEDGQLGAVAADWSPQSIAALLERTVAEPQLARALAMRAETRVRAEYDIGVTARRYHRLYASLLEEARVA